MSWLVFAMRWFHLLAAMIVVGGTIFLRFALAPSVGALADEHRKALHEQVRSRWSRLVMAATAFLLVSGFVNYWVFYQTIKTQPWDHWRQSFNAVYQAAFGIKFLLSMAIFFIASAVSGRSESLKSFRQNAKFWMSVNIILALAVVGLAGILRMTHVGPTLQSISSPDAPAVAVPAGGDNG